MVLPEGANVPSDLYRFFCVYFLCDLISPFSDFFGAMMMVYGFHLMDFTSNAMACMAIITHLCENFVGVVPNLDLFGHFFVPRVEDKSHY